MQSIVQAMKVLADPIRIRVLRLLEREELTVAELQEILSMGQSTISSHLAQMRRAGLVEDRKTGKNVLYRLRRASPAALLDVAEEAAREIVETGRDKAALDLILEKRRDRTRAFFDELAGKFGRNYVPGRSWRGLAEALLELMPPVVAADLGAGEGAVAQLLARRARRVIAVDNSVRMAEYGRRMARERGIGNLEYRVGDMEKLPLDDESVDVAFFSQSLHHAQHPERAMKEAFRVLKAGGRVVALDLVKHNRAEARELYADEWLGFTELEIREFMVGAGFAGVSTSVVHREERAPHFETLLAVGERAAVQG